MSAKKIYILGTSGSGKSSLAKKISNKLDIEYFDLDEIEWKEKYTTRRNEKDKVKEIDKILKKDKWIIEGVYESWTEKAVDKSDILIWLLPKSYLIKIRLLKRFIIKKLKNEGFDPRGLKTLVKFTKAYCDPSGKNKACQGHKKLVERNPKKLIKLKNKKEIRRFLKSLK